jgi:hypothetical protein
MDIQHIAVTEAGKDHPRDLNEFVEWFGSEEACLGYLERLRWPQGPWAPATVTRNRYSAAVRASHRSIWCRCTRA